MKKFDFPLSRVAKWSQQKLSVEQLALLRIIKELAEVDEKLQILRKQVQDGQRDLQGQTVLTGRELQALGLFVRRLAEQRTQFQKVRSALERKLEAQRQRVVAEHRKVKLFENLHARRKEEWTQQLSKEEDAFASDLFLAKLARDLRLAQTDAGI